MAPCLAWQKLASWAGRPRSSPGCTGRRWKVLTPACPGTLERAAPRWRPGARAGRHRFPGVSPAVRRDERLMEPRHRKGRAQHGHVAGHPACALARLPHATHRDRGNAVPFGRPRGPASGPHARAAPEPRPDRLPRLLPAVRQRRRPAALARPAERQGRARGDFCLLRRHPRRRVWGGRADDPSGARFAF